MKNHLSAHGRWIFHLENYKVHLIDKSYIFNYELLLKLMPFEIPTPFVQALTKYIERLKQKIFQSFEGLNELKVLVHYMISLFAF